MKQSTRLFTVAVTVLLIGASGCSKQINQLRARSELNRGVKSFEAANFVEAAGHFSEALNYDPDLLAARTYRASSMMMQYVPGSDSPENLKVASDALAGFEEVLKYDPNNQLAMSSIASLYYNMAKAEEAKEWNLKLIQAFPDKKEPYYTIGVIDWGQAYKRRGEVRSETGMRAEDPGPIKDVKKRQALAEELKPLHDEALQMFNKALELDPDYEDAMNYLNLVYRSVADVAETSEEYERLSNVADEWVQKTLDTRKRLAEASSRDLVKAE